MLERKCLAPLAIASGLFMGMGMATEAGAGTIAHWRFEPDDPGTATNEFLADSAGSNHLTNHNGVVESSATPTGYGGSTGSASFDGTDDGLSTTSTLDLSGVTDLTIEWFMKPVDGETQGVVVEHSENYNANNGAFLAWVRGAGELVGGQRATNTQGTADYYVDEVAGAVTDSWTHYAMVIDGSETDEDRIKLFVDYEQVTPTGGRLSDSLPAFLNDTLFIGSREGGDNLHYAGLLDELRISDEVLAPSQFLGVPEPASMALVGVGSALLLGRRR